MQTITIKDVAEKACVAPSTVSFVLNRAVASVRISESTQQRVLKAIEAAAKKGASFGAPTLAETELAQKIAGLFDSIEKVRLVL